MAIVFLCGSAPAAYAADANADSRARLDKAISEYQAGHYDKAAQILAQDLKDHPDDGVTHYYLGMVKKRLGDDSDALNELEWAARLCPPEVIGSLAKQATDPNNTELPKPPLIIPAKNDWFSVLSTSVGEMFGGKKPEAKITEKGTIELPPQDFGGSMEEMYKQSKQWFRSVTEKKKAGESPHSNYQSWAADIMPMGDMLALVDKSRYINNSIWSSHEDGVKKFAQAPENTAQWDSWIARFKRSFQHVLMNYLSTDAKEQVTGMAACIFSIEKNGSLRGHIYASTGDNVLNAALLKTIRSLNHSRILEFPQNSRVTGWNFRMTWNFGKLLKYIQAYRAYKKYLAEQQAQQTLVSTSTDAKLQGKKAGEQAKADKLKPDAKSATKVAATRLQPLSVKVKTNVAGLVLPRAAQMQLQAVAQSISDKSVSTSKGTPDTDIFGTISDREIMSWPDLSR